MKIPYIAVQEQKWPSKDHIIFLIPHAKGTASVQLELYDKEQDWDNFKGTAFIWGLWVDEPLRRLGFAEILMDKAEEYAKAHGHKSVFLEWSIKESPVEIFQWYERRGYEEKAFSTGENANALMKKQLNEISL